MWMTLLLEDDVEQLRKKRQVSRKILFQMTKLTGQDVLLSQDVSCYQNDQDLLWPTESISTETHITQETVFFYFTYTTTVALSFIKTTDSPMIRR